VLLTIITPRTGTHLGQYTSTGSVLRVDDTVSGTETFTAASADHFVKSFTGAFQPDGRLVGSYTLGGGTGRFAGIGGSDTFTVVFDADGTDFDLTIVGEAVFADHGQP
jgi:hypothetical protein